MGTNRRYYEAKATEWALGESSSGKEQVVVSFHVLTPDAQEQRLTWYGYFTEKTADRTLESLRHCGWTGDDLTDLTGLDANEVQLVVEDEEYEGKVTAKVQWVNKAGGLALKAPLAPDKAKAFAASMRDRIRAMDAAGGVRKPSAAPKPASLAAPEPPPHSDADLPF
jgi:hypothetical protein